MKKILLLLGLFVIQSTTMVFAQTDYEKADKALNESYTKVMKILPDEQKKSLRGIQRLWIKYRDSNCSIHSDKNSLDACK